MLDSADLEPRVREILDAHSGVEGALLPILHAVQDAFGHVPEEALPLIAADQTLSKAEAWRDDLLPRFPRPGPPAGMC
jgi:formate dehydrogenase subunit gamma